MSEQTPGTPVDKALWWAALRRVVSRLLDELERASADPTFRDDLATVLQGLPGSDQSPAPSGPTAPALVPAETDVNSTSEAADPATPAPSAEPLPPLTLGEPASSQAVEYPREWTAELFDPLRVSTRCRLKARAARWQGERRKLLDGGIDVSQQDRDLCAKAEAEEVFLWMVTPWNWREQTDVGFTIVAECYDALADAAELMELADRLRRDQKQAMKLLAEAQSALRVAIKTYSTTRRDDDQETTFRWLRRQTDERRVYVHFMQLDHPADPANHADLRQRIALPRAELERHCDRESRIDQSFKKIAYHAGKLRELPADQALSAEQHDLRNIAAAADELFALGVAPSHVRLRELLLEFASRIPAEAPEPLARIMRAFDDYMDQQQAEEYDAEPPNDAPDPLIAQARSLVQGRHAVMIGGLPKDGPRLALQDGLGLASLNWVRIEHHESFDSTESAIRRPEVGLVILLTRWRSHRDGPAARAVCSELGIPLIELPAGYNIRQVAHQIIRQLRPPVPASA